MKGAALAFPAIAAVGLSLVVLLVLAVAAYPKDNPAPWTAISYFFLAAPVAAAILAWSAAVFIFCNRFYKARKALALQAAVATVLLLAALSASSHSDGKLLAFAFAIEVCALLAFVLSKPSGTRPTL